MKQKVFFTSAMRFWKVAADPSLETGQITLQVGNSSMALSQAQSS
jgi:hypothetical protein